MISVYTDGSSHAKGGQPGGWAYFIVSDGVPLNCNAGNNQSTTNNVMELTAAIEGLQFVKNLTGQKSWQPVRVELVSDSEYVLGIASGAFEPVKNLELAYRLQSLVKALGAKTRWVRGHSGDIFNEGCDTLAKAFKTEICKNERCLKENDHRRRV